MLKPRNPAKLFTLLLLLTTAAITKAQEFGGNPPAIKWNQVNTPEVKVIFPLGMDSAGRRVANVIHNMNRLVQPTIGYKQRQVSVVLQNQNTISNAYVQLAPFRSEFYLTPLQNSFDIGSITWIDQLAIHEYRHVQQYNNFNVGLSKGLRFLFGEGGQSLGNALSVPDWFFEGDAVYNETLVSKQGRGRIPYFFNGYRALWAEGKNYSYMKLRNGSYRDYVPDHYPLGYMLVSYGREKYGNAFWRDVTHNAASYNSLFYPFQHAFKKQAGVDFDAFRNDALQSFKKTFNDQQVARPNKKQHFIADAEYPAYVNDNSLVYIKSAYNHRPVFVLKTGNTEKQIRVKDISLDNYFAYHDGRIVYAAYNVDPRWGYRTYSDLRLLDINTGAQQNLTNKTKYFAPDFNADGRKVVAVQVDPSGRSELHILNTADGKVLSVIPNPAHVFYTYPKFYGDDQIVSAVRDKSGAMSICLVDIKTGKIQPYGIAGYAPIGFPTVHKDSIYFSAADGRREKLFVLVPGKNQLYAIDHDSLQSSIGNYQPALNNNKLAWVSFTAEGYKIHEVNKGSLNIAAVKPGGSLPTDNMGVNLLNKPDSATNMLAAVTNEPLQVAKYSKAHHLFNFHSLVPEFDDPNYSLSLMGQNVLNTFQSSLLFNYNRDEGYKQFGFSAAYGGLYPYLVGSATYTADRRRYYRGSDVYWNETSLRAGLQLPLTFINGAHVTGVTLGTDVIYNSTRFQTAYRNLFADRAYTYLNHQVAISNRISQARQHIYPRFAQSLTLNYKYTVSGPASNQFLASGALYLPGLLVNHNLVITGAYQQKNKNNVISFSNNFPFSRGYQAENLYRLEKVGVSYHFPIAYPDAGIANTVYFSRIRGNIFYDHTHAYADDLLASGAVFKANFRTAGAELYFDTKWFNQASITFGLRYSHLLNNDVFGSSGRDRIELIVPLTIF